MTTVAETRWEYLVVPLQEAKGLKKSTPLGSLRASMNWARRAGRRLGSR